MRDYANGLLDTWNFPSKQGGRDHVGTTQGSTQFDTAVDAGGT